MTINIPEWLLWLTGFGLGIVLLVLAGLGAWFLYLLSEDKFL